MDSNDWNIGFFDKNGTLISDNNISTISEDNMCSLSEMKPVIWFGTKDVVTNCWSITPETEDSFIKDFWGEYYDGAMNFIFKADSSFFYYTVCEYSLDYDSKLFEKIKANCPIDLNLPQAERNNALHDLVKSEYLYYFEDRVKCLLELAAYKYVESVYKNWYNDFYLQSVDGLIQEEIDKLDPQKHFYVNSFDENRHPYKDKLYEQVGEQIYQWFCDDDIQFLISYSPIKIEQEDIELLDEFDLDYYIKEGVDKFLKETYGRER